MDTYQRPFLGFDIANNNDSNIIEVRSEFLSADMLQSAYRSMREQSGIPDRVIVNPRTYAQLAEGVQSIQYSSDNGTTWLDELPPGSLHQTRVQFHVSPNPIPYTIQEHTYEWDRDAILDMYRDASIFGSGFIKISTYAPPKENLDCLLYCCDNCSAGLRHGD